MSLQATPKFLVTPVTDGAPAGESFGGGSSNGSSTHNAAAMRLARPGEGLAQLTHDVTEVTFPAGSHPTQPLSH